MIYRHLVLAAQRRRAFQDHLFYDAWCHWFSHSYYLVLFFCWHQVLNSSFCFEKVLTLTVFINFHTFILSFFHFFSKCSHNLCLQQTCTPPLKTWIFNPTSFPKLKNRPWRSLWFCPNSIFQSPRSLLVVVLGLFNWTFLESLSAPPTKSKSALTPEKHPPPKRRQRPWRRSTTEPSTPTPPTMIGKFLMTLQKVFPSPTPSTSRKWKICSARSVPHELCLNWYTDYLYCLRPVSPL